MLRRGGECEISGGYGCAVSNRGGLGGGGRTLEREAMELGGQY